MREYVVYILRCADKSLYVGVTNNLRRRLNEHAEGINDEAYTHDRRPIKLVYVESYTYVCNAIHREKVLKNWSMKKKEALIKNDREELRLFSKKNFPKRYQRQFAGIRFRRLQCERFRIRHAFYEALVPRTLVAPQRATRDDKCLQREVPRYARRCAASYSANMLKNLPE